MVARFDHDENMVIAALLHDTVEDTSVTLEDIEFEFGAGVADWVKDLTDVSYPTDGHRAARKQKICCIPQPYNREPKLSRSWI